MAGTFLSHLVMSRITSLPAFIGTNRATLGQTAGPLLPDMNPVLKEIMLTGHVRRCDGRLLPIHSSITMDQGRFLQTLIDELSATVTLEVGLGYGVSALFICDAIGGKSGARHVVIDPNQERLRTGGDSWDGVGLENLRRAGYGELIEFHEEPSHLALPALESSRRRFDLAFIDGWHTFDHALVDFFYLDHLLKVGGTVVLDDADWPSLRKLCRFIATNRAYRVLRCHVQDPCSGVPLRHQLRQLAGGLPKTMARLLRDEIINPDLELGLIPGSRCIAFTKVADDTRGFDFHRAF